MTTSESEMEERTERAVRAAAEALHKAVCFNVPCPHQADSFIAKARICVEAAAPILSAVPNDVADLANQGLLAEVEKLRAEVEQLRPFAQFFDATDRVHATRTEVLKNWRAAKAAQEQKARIDTRVAEKRGDPCPIDYTVLAEEWTRLVEDETGHPWREASSGIVTHAMLRCLNAHSDGGGCAQ
jgi:hypothetical protein